MILGDLSILADGGPVEVLPAKPIEEKVADEAPRNARRVLSQTHRESSR